MPRKDLSEFTATEREQSSLNYVLRAQKRVQEEGDVYYQPVEEALSEKGVFKIETSRDVTRLLFISQEENLLNPTKQTLDGFVNIADLFDEVHILMLRPGIPAKNPVLRVAENVWLYTATARHWWWTPVAGLRLLDEQLVFADGFRPDLIVARDPFEAAAVAYVAGKRYGRPTQVHILQDYTRAEFALLRPGNRWRRFLARFFIKRFASVRTLTYAMSELLTQQYTIPDLKPLPRFSHYESLIAVPSTLDLKAQYKPFVFIMLYVGRLSHTSTLHRAIDAARFVLRNPRVGLVVLGDGPAKKEFQKRTEILGIKEQVVFESRQVDVVQYLKGANVLIVSDTDTDGDDIAIKGAACGVPLVLAQNSEREDLFVDGTSAMLFPPEDIQECTNKINTLLNNVALRQQMSEAAQDMVRQKFHEDPEAYRLAYRESVEQALFVDRQSAVLVEAGAANEQQS